MTVPGNIRRVAFGEPIGTIVERESNVSVGATH
jgi:hypothetical protein